MYLCTCDTRSDIGQEVGFEAVGVIDSKLPTTGVWARKTDEVRLWCLQLTQHFRLCCLIVGISCHLSVVVPTCMPSAQAIPYLMFEAK